MICPFCQHDNIAGVDRCEECMHPLRDLDVPKAGNGFQGHIMKDAVQVLNLAHPVSVSIDDPVQRAIERMKQNQIGCALVLEGEKLVGIFTERDVLYRLAGTEQHLDQRTVRQVMTPDPAKLKAKDSIATALHKMSVGEFRHLPVVTDENAVVGIVSIKDILAYIYQKALYHKQEQSA